MTDTLVTSVRTCFEKYELRSQVYRDWLAMVGLTSRLRTQRLKQEFKFQASLSSIVILCLKRKKQDQTGKQKEHGASLTLGNLPASLCGIIHNVENNNRWCTIIVRPNELIMNMIYSVPCLAHDKHSQCYSYYSCGRPKYKELRGPKTYVTHRWEWRGPARHSLRLIAGFQCEIIKLQQFSQFTSPTIYWVPMCQSLSYIFWKHKGESGIATSLKGFTVK